MVLTDMKDYLNNIWNFVDVGGLVLTLIYGVMLIFARNGQRSEEHTPQ